MNVYDSLLGSLLALRPYTEKRVQYLDSSSTPFTLIKNVSTYKRSLGWIDTNFGEAVSNYVFWKFRGAEDLNKIISSNGGFSLMGPLIHGAALSGVAYVEVLRNEAGLIQLTPFNALQAYGTITARGTLYEAVSVLDEDSDGIQAIKYYDCRNRTATIFANEGGVFQEVATETDVVLAHISFRTSLDKPYGRSLISKAAMRLSDFGEVALKVVTNLTIGLEDTTKFLLGTDDKVVSKLEAPDAAERIKAKEFVAISSGSDGRIPSLAEVLGNNPDKATEALGQFKEELDSCFKTYKDTPGYYREELGASLRDLGAVILAVRDQTPIVLNKLNANAVIWKPVNVDLGSVGDALFKINKVVPGYFGVDQVNEILGIEGGLSGSLASKLIQELGLAESVEGVLDNGVDASLTVETD